MSKPYNSKHLTLNERLEIEKCIYNGMLKIDIARKLNKDKSIISKEIMNNKIYYTKQRTYPVECINFPKCPNKNRCTKPCEHYIQFKYYRRDFSPGACNGYSNKQ